MKTNYVKNTVRSFLMQGLDKRVRKCTFLTNSESEFQSKKFKIILCTIYSTFQMNLFTNQLISSQFAVSMNLSSVQTKQHESPIITSSVAVSSTSICMLHFTPLNKITHCGSIKIPVRDSINSHTR